MSENKKDTKTLSFALSGYKFSADTKFLSYQHVYGKSFRVLIKDIDSVSLDVAGFGKNKLRINGKGVVLAELELAKPWAEKVQDFIYEVLKNEK